MRQQINELKKSIIIEVADKAFQTFGYEATAVSNIAKEAEVSIGTIYGFFESKDGLFRAVHDFKISQAHQFLHTMFENNPDSPRENLKGLLTFYFTEITQHKISVQEMLLSSPFRIGCASSNDDPSLALYKLIASEIEKLHKKMPLHATDFLQYAFNLRNQAAAYIERWAMLDDIVLIEKVDECFESFLRGIVR